MKNKLLGILLLAMLFAGCQSDPSLDGSASADSKIKITATTSADTKIGFEASDSVIALTWESTDSFSVYDATGTYVGDFNYTGEAGVNSGTFTQDGDFTMADGEYTAVIPAVTHSTLTDRDDEDTTSEQSVDDVTTLSHLNGSVKMRSDFTYSAASTQSITFSHELSMLKVTILMTDGIIPASVTLADGNAYDYLLTLPSDLTSSSIVTYMSLEANDAAAERDLVFEVTDTDGAKYEKSITTSAVFEAGYFYSATLDFDDSQLEVILDFSATNTLSIDDTAITIGDQTYLLSKDGAAGWGLIFSTNLTYESGLSGLKINIPQAGHYSWSGYTFCQLMFGLYSETYQNSNIAAPETIYSGEERYTHFSTAFQGCVPSAGETVIMRALQSEATGVSADNLPIVELGWNEEGTFGAWARSGAIGSDNTTVEFMEVACPFVVSPSSDLADFWYDIVVAYKFSPSSTNGWLKVYIKEKDASKYKEYVMENIKVGYSDAPSSLETLEIGYRGVGQTEACYQYVSNIAYRDFNNGIESTVVTPPVEHKNIVLDYTKWSANSLKPTTVFTLDGVEYLYDSENISWGTLTSQGKTRTTGHYSLKFNAAGTITSNTKQFLALFSENYNDALGGWPEIINDGDERYQTASFCFDGGGAVPSTDAILMRVFQSKASSNADDNQAIVELGWNTDGKFGAWVRSGTSGASDDVKLSFLEIDAPFVADIWTDIVLAYKFSPDSANGWVKIYHKQQNTSDFAEYTLSDIQVGYSEAASTIDMVEYGYYAAAQSNAVYMYTDYVTYKDAYSVVVPN